MFRDRKHAADCLAALLPHSWVRPPLVLAVPPGGVPIAASIAAELGCDFGLVLVRRLIDPRNPSLTVGSVDISGAVHSTSRRPSANPRALSGEAWFQGRALERLAGIVGKRADLEVEGRSVIVVDDGAHTGSTMIGAVRRLRSQGAAHITVALPIVPARVAQQLRALADQVVCVQEASGPVEIRAAYTSIPSLTDADICRIFSTLERRLARETPRPAPEHVRWDG